MTFTKLLLRSEWSSSSYGQRTQPSPVGRLRYPRATVHVFYARICALFLTQHLLHMPLFHRCVCRTGKTTPDGRMCVNETNFIVFAQGALIRFSAIRPGDRLALPKTIESLTSVVGLDFDFESQRLFYAVNQQNKSIMSVFLNGTDVRTVAPGA